MSDTVVQVQNLSKQYTIGRLQKRNDTLRDVLVAGWQRSQHSLMSMLHRFKASTGETAEADNRFWALQDISFEMKQGEVLGIIGHNGAGKILRR